MYFIQSAGTGITNTLSRTFCKLIYGIKLPRVLAGETIIVEIYK